MADDLKGAFHRPERKTMTAAERRRQRKGIDPSEALDALTQGDGSHRPAREVEAAPVSMPTTPTTMEIFRIRPDMAQPRRTIPALVRNGWVGDPSHLGDVFVRWTELLAQHVSMEYDAVHQIVLATLHGEETQRVSIEWQPGPIGSSLLKVVDLAASIRRDGLINPIHIAQDDDAYIIETGERRWLAFHLLNMVFEGEYAEIPFTLVERVNVWKQAFENNARADLNAVGKARQFARLLMDLYQESIFAPPQNCESERAYYAQVADGEAFRIPRGQGDQMLQAMGTQDRTELSRYRSVLTLPDLVWEIADDLDWTLGKLRPLLSVTDEEAIRRAVRDAKKEGYMLAIANVYDDIEEPPKPEKRSMPYELTSVATTKLAKINRKQVKKMPEEDWREMLNQFASLRAQMAEIEKWRG